MAIRPGTEHRARPTLYNGIQMRSRLEANYAQLFLDRFRPGQWKYEPECFASTNGQYLPDFLLNGIYIEIKPANIDLVQGHPTTGVNTSEVDAILERMEIVWASKPRASLWLCFWEYDIGDRDCLSANGDARIWWWLRDGDWSLWPGRGQLEAVTRHRQGEPNG